MADFYKDDDMVEDTEKLPVEEQDGSVLYIEPDEDVEEDSGEGEKEGGKKKKGGIFSELFDCFETFCYALVLMMLMFVFVFRFVTVNGTSMINTLKNEDKLIISDVMYTPETGDIVVLDANGLFSDRYIIKRIIATGGQRVDIDFFEWTVTVDGQLLEESYVNREFGYMDTAYWIETDESVTKNYDNGFLHTASFTVPEGELFVMGDNRNGSSDSRLVGCLEEDRVLGRVLLRIGPKNSFGRVG